MNSGVDNIDANENKLLEGCDVVFLVDGGEEISDVGFVKYFLHFNYSYIIRSVHIYKLNRFSMGNSKSDNSSEKSKLPFYKRDEDN